MSKLGDALRERFGNDPRKVIEALGLDAAVLKETEMATKPTKFASMALEMTVPFIRPFLAKDAKIDLGPVFNGVTRKNFKAKEIKLALDAALKGKLAKDADPGMGNVSGMLEKIEHMTKPEVMDESVSEPQHKAMEAAAHGESNLGIPQKVGKEFEHADKGKTFDAGGMENLKGFLKEKGMSEDDVGAACDMLFKKSANDAEESEEDKMKREEAEKKKAAEDKAARDAAEADKMKDMVSKPAMDAAISAAVTATAKSIRETERGVRMALDEVKPWVGEIPSSMAFDSKVDVYRHAAGMIPAIAADAKTMHADALLHVIRAQPKPGARPVDRGEREMALDSSTAERTIKRFPGIEKIGIGI